jgi:hypothetical protein
MPNRSLFLKPGIRREKVRRGQRLARHFWGHWADSGRQRPRYPASPAAKPRKVKDYSDGARKADLRGTAWWRTHPAATGLQAKFPDNRENNREFLNLRTFFCDSRSQSASKFRGLQTHSLRNGTGTYFRAFRPEVNPASDD